MENEVFFKEVIKPGATFFVDLDGLNRVAEDYNFQQSEIPSWTRQLPFYSLFEGYALRSVSDPALAKSVAGFLGTLVVLGGTWGLGVYLRARNRKP